MWEGPEEEVAPRDVPLPLDPMDRCPGLADLSVSEIPPPSPEHKGQNHALSTTLGGRVWEAISQRQTHFHWACLPHCHQYNHDCSFGFG